MILIVYVSIDRLSVAPWGNPIGDTLLAELAGDTRVGQQFTAPFPGLYRIEVTLDRGTSRNEHPVTFHLARDPSGNEELWTANLNTSDVQDGAPYGFEFPPLRDSKGQSYYFYLQSTNSTPEEAVAVRYGPAAFVDGANAYVDSQPVAGNLQFLTYYTLRTRDKVDLLLTRMAEGRPYFLGAKAFDLGLAVTYAVVLGIFLWRTAQAVLEEEG
jgi:hypothetical protein